MPVVLAVVLGAFLSFASAGTAAEWKYRNIYQLLTDRFSQTNGGTGFCPNLSDYCGGTFQGVIKNLDYIQGLGFNAIWISPMVANTPEGYHGYWAQNIYQVNPNFGTEQDLLQLVQECHSRDIWVMLDVVANHMGNPTSIGDFSIFTPFNSASDFHSYCQIQDWTNQQQVEFCWLANLPDLAQENSYVASTLTAWINNTVQTYGFDGIRIDTVPEVPTWFWTEYAAAAGVFQMGEVDNGNVQYVAGYQPPLTATLNYPLFYTLQQTYAQHQSMYNIRSQNATEFAAFHDMTVLGTFIDNHDNSRFLCVNSDWNLLSNALVYTLFAQLPSVVMTLAIQGIPIVYYGTEQGFNGCQDPNNRENLWSSNFNTEFTLYQFIATVNKFRSSVTNTFIQSPMIERYCDDTFYAFSRNMTFLATSNIGSGQSTSRTITFHPFIDGTTLVNVLNPSDTVTVQNGQFQVNIVNGMPKIYYPSNLMAEKFLKGKNIAALFDTQLQRHLQ